MSAGVVALVLAALRAEPGATVLDVARAVHRSSPEVLLLGERDVAGVLEMLRSEGLVQVEDGRWSARDGWASPLPVVGGDGPTR